MENNWVKLYWNPSVSYALESWIYQNFNIIRWQKTFSVATNIFLVWERGSSLIMETEIVDSVDHRLIWLQVLCCLILIYTVLKIIFMYFISLSPDCVHPKIIFPLSLFVCWLVRPLACSSSQNHFVPELVCLLACSSFELFVLTWNTNIVCLFFQITNFLHWLPWEMPHQCFQRFNPFPHNDTFWCPWETSLLKTLWEKEKFSRNKQFLLFPRCFLPVWINFCHFHQIWKCRLQTLSVWKSLKFVVWERVNIAFNPAMNQSLQRAREEHM